MPEEDQSVGLPGGKNDFLMGVVSIYEDDWRDGVVEPKMDGNIFISSPFSNCDDLAVGACRGVHACRGF